jgi:predicted acyltransferase
MQIMRPQNSENVLAILYCCQPVAYNKMSLSWIMNNSTLNPQSNPRVLSLDVMRGLIMIFLGGESCLLYASLRDLHPSGVYLEIIDMLFEHHPWHGLHVWDLIQPAFMLMAGSALYLSYHFKLQKGISWEANFRHVAIRCLKLFLLGTGLHCVSKGQLVWELWNVLTQLSFTLLLAYIILRKSNRFQLIFSFLLLILTEVLYRYAQIPGYDQPFVIGKNFGSWMDMVLMGKLNNDGWVAINCIPSAAHTIWGVLAGKLLISAGNSQQKIRKLVIAGTIGVVVGYALDLFSITPIIKRICTSSFILASGGWVLLVLALLYWITDVKKVNRYAWIFVVVGMNSIFIYLFYGTVGYQWFNGIVAIFVKGFTGLMGIPDKIQALLSAIVTLFAEWYLCYWLYKKKIFFKL